MGTSSLAKLKPSDHISHDWLESAILNVCQKAFPSEDHLSVDSIAPREESVCPHQDYTFFLRSPDAEFRILLRLHYGFFSFWQGTDDNKSWREFSILRHVYRLGYPAPFAYSFSGSCLPFGRSFVVMDPGDGERWEDFQDSFREVQEKIVDSMAEEMVKLHHSIEPAISILEDVEIQPLFRLLWQRVSGLKDMGLERFFRACEKRIQGLEPLDPVLVHGSMDLRNVLIQNDYVRTVLNWEHAILGDPRWDVAYTKLAIQKETDRSLANRFVESYTNRAGMELHDLDIWEGLVALKMYALAQWLKSLDDRSLFAVAGLRSLLLSWDDFFEEITQAQFG
ncbi:phosphotransferase [bacterium]|nr:phosphotransferase [bacterium]